MDLFDDLPAPTGSVVSSSNKSTSSSYDDLPLKVVSKTPDINMVGDALYGDLPSQTVTEPTVGNKVAVKRKLVEESNGRNEDTKKKKMAKYKLTSFLAERQGEREDMQDGHLIIKDFTSQFTNLDQSVYRISIYGVFDGHGGVRASRFASVNLHKNLRDKFPKGDIAQIEKDIKKAFMEAFKKTDDDFLKEAAKYKPVWKDGTTAILVLLLNETMLIANIGDSQAVLCRYKEEANCCVSIPLSVPHNPSMYDERMRIQKQGGHVKDGRVMGVLEVSRSIGDGQYKKLGVTCTPDVKKCQITDNDRFVIIACDGLWKCFDPESSIKFVNQVLDDKSIQATDTRSARDVRFDLACNKLANEAVLRLSGDNVTVLLLAISTDT